MSDDAEFTERRTQSLWERLDGIEAECRRGHRDLRKSVSELEAQADAFEHDLKSLNATVDRAASAPVEATRVRFSTGVLVVLVSLTVTLVGGGWKISTKIDTIATEMYRLSEDDKRERASLAKLYDERNGRYEKSLDSMARQVELLKYEQQRLREDVTKKNGSSR